MKTRCILLLFALLGYLPLTAASTIPAELFDPGFLEGDSNYHSLTAASDGYLYFTVNTHHEQVSARFYRFDPESEEIEEIAQMNDILGEDIDRMIPHGKVHTPLFESEGALYFATHTSSYEGTLPNLIPDDGRDPYPGGHFVRYDLESGEFKSLAQVPLKNEGIITMTMDTQRQRLYGLTWPTGLLFTYEVRTGNFQQYGATQTRGEWGHYAEDWEFICRKLAVAPDGRLYGSTNRGRIWEFDATKQRPLSFTPLSLKSVLTTAEADFKLEAVPHYFWGNWRTITWNPATSSFWGLHGGSSQLFEYDPSEGRLRSIANLRPEGVPQGLRNPLRTQLGFTLGPDNTLFYLAHGPALPRDGRRPTKANVHLITHAIDTAETVDHGPVLGPDDRRVFFTESIEIAPDGHIYSVAWVETVDPARMRAIQESRGDALPAETRDVIYEIQLIRLPPATTFLD